MSLRFILGRAGTGKTYTCLEGIRQSLRENPAGPPLVLLVPEQATFQMDYALISTPDLPGVSRAQVLSFRRLAWRVFLEAGGAARPHIGELGKRMALRALLQRRQADLAIFCRAARQPGFTDRLARTIAELRVYGINEKDLESQYAALARAGTDATVLAGKLHDLAIVYRDFETYLQGRYVDPDDYLTLLAERLQDAPSVQGATFWVDGFTGFTPQEYRVLGALLRSASRVHVTLCLDHRELVCPPQETDLFHPTRETYHKLVDLAKNMGARIEEPLTLTPPINPRFTSRALAHVETQFFGRPGREYTGEVDEISLVGAANRWAEVEAVAREIIRLCRDQGYRWRDMAVILRDMDAYQGLVAAVFTDYGIPYFIDRKRPVLHHPLVELLRAALEVVVTNWACDPVFRYLKTDLVPVSRGAVDELENYVLAHGIRGRRWIDDKPWRYRRQYTLGEEREVSPGEEATLARINRTREKAAGALGRFYRKLASSKQGRLLTVSQVTTALFELLVDLRVPDTLERWRREAEEAGDLDAAREHSQVWDGVVSLLDQVVEALGEEEMDLPEYAQVLEAGLESLRLGLIPPGLDQVLVGTVERSRNPDLMAAFMVGINDGIFPARAAEDEIFTDGERDELASRGVHLAPPGRVRLFHEQYLVYIALTRASERLWISYPLADQEGKALAPSSIIGRVKELFPGLKESFLGLEPAGAVINDLTEDTPELEFIINRRRTVAYLGSLLRKAETGRPLPLLWAYVYQWYISDEARRSEAGRVLDSMRYGNHVERLPEELVREIFGNPISTSVSRLESFAACPFSHFAAHGLGLRERTIYRLEAPDMGAFFHAALKVFVDRLRERSLDWGTLEDDQRYLLVQEVVEDLAPKLQGEILLSSARYRYLSRSLRRTLHRAVGALGAHARQGCFRPAAVEVGFGYPGELPPLRLELRPGWFMELKGRIDRVDSARGKEREYIRVIDYKSRATDLRIRDVYHGLALQLLTYLGVALEHADQLAGGPATPAGVLYFGVQDPMVHAVGPLTGEELNKEIRKKLKMRGLVLDDPEVVELMHGGLSGRSDLIPVTVKKDGTLSQGKGSRVVTPEQVDMLLKFLHHRLRQLGRRITRGEAQVAPYRQGTRTPCTYCAFKPACQFDSLVEGNGYRFLRDAAEEFWWKKIAEVVEGGKGDE
ncbi:ATP-dependent helicase [Clostridiales bacterium PH28_bin88]|nr:ATP-dependent helicase [Clostridiales bacterium PH28_bin88]